MPQEQYNKFKFSGDYGKSSKYFFAAKVFLLCNAFRINKFYGIFVA